MSRPTYFAAVASVFFFFFSPPLYSQRSQTGCLPYFHTWCSLSPNLEFMSEMCCTRRAENTVRKNLRRKIGILCAPSPKFVGYIFAIRASIDNRKVNLLNSNICSIRLHGELRPISGWDRLTSFGYPSKFQRITTPKRRQSRYRQQI